jgi:hypothetical protein
MPALPLTIAGRSPFDPIRLRWSGLGNILLGMGCAFGAGGVGGVVFGILFILLGIATWIITKFGAIPWHEVSGVSRVLVSTGAIIGTVFLYLFFFYLFIFFFVLKIVLKWMAE